MKYTTLKNLDEIMVENQKNVSKYRLTLNGITYFMDTLKPYSNKKITRRELPLNEECGYKELCYKEGDDYVSLSIDKNYNGENTIKVHYRLNGYYHNAYEYEQVIGREYSGNTIEVWGDLISLWEGRIKEIKAPKELVRDEVKSILDEAESKLKELYAIDEKAKAMGISLERY